MSQVQINPFEAILRRIAAAAPEPWYPRAFAKERGLELDGLTYLLEYLWLEGLIRNTAPVDGAGAGVVLSPEGERVLQDPEALQRLRDGRPLVEGDRGGLIRLALRRASKPVVTRVLVALNVLVFGYGAYLAWGQGVFQNYLKGFTLGARGLLGFQNLLGILHQTGSVTGADVLTGQWWRLLSSAFVHMGLIHLGMNMYILYRGGPMIEQMWGRLRYLAIYLVSAWLGGCLAIAYGPRVLYQGASGAICGLLAAEALWIVLNRRYLPGSVLRRARSAIFVNTLLLVAISLVGGVSGWGHGGGALGGALAALLLHVQRFGPSPWRWLAVPAVAAVPALGVYFIQHERAVNPQWQALGAVVAQVNRQQAAEKEEQDFDAAYDPAARQTVTEALTFYNERVHRLEEMEYRRRPPAEVEKVLAEIPEQRRKLGPVRERLARAGPYQTAEVEAVREKRLRTVTSLEHALRSGGKTLRDDAAQLDFETKYLPRVRRVTKAAADLYEQVEPLLVGRPARRAPAKVTQALKGLADGRRALNTLAEDLAKAGPSPAELVETARKKATEYVRASAQLLAQAERCLRAGDRWTDADEEALQRQAEAVTKLRGEWGDLVK
jgi:membrane associated rhomboid family serine protease